MSQFRVNERAKWPFLRKASGENKAGAGDRACFELRKMPNPPRSAMFRMAVGHVSHDERPSIAMREVEFEGRNVDTKTQPFDYKHVAKTRRESRISAKYFCRGKEMCSLQYRLLRFLTPTPESASWLPIHPTTSDGKSHVGQQPYHGVSTPRAMGVPSSLI